ncbi:polysaccharide pyruvyl transferase family protein [Candidatus Roizmanbacteria bacterium]|nr:polysaccharide pyruvyl transferase family protein [Candidatus Roizmanbacteria bacterium]
MDIKSGIEWRYRKYFNSSLRYDRNILKAVSRRLHNIIESRSASVLSYISADSVNPGDRASALGVKFLANNSGVELYASKSALRETLRVLERLKKKGKCPKVVVGGGGLLQECFNPFWEELLHLSIPFVMFGIGANTLKAKRDLPSQSLLDGIASSAAAIHVRDRMTQQLLQRGQASNPTVGVCPSVNYIMNRFQNKYNFDKTHLLHVLHPSDILMSGGNQEQLSIIVKKAAKELGLQYDETFHSNESLDSLLKRYKRARFVVSSRLHGCIFSFAVKTPFVGVVCDKKVSAFIETHAPEAPTMDVNFTLDECIKNILHSETNNKIDFPYVLKRNEVAMKDALEKLYV